MRKPWGRLGRLHHSKEATLQFKARALFMGGTRPNVELLVGGIALTASGLVSLFFLSPIALCVWLVTILLIAENVLVFVCRLILADFQNKLLIWHGQCLGCQWCS